MYLSRLELNPRTRQAYSDLRSAYSLHQSLRWAFPAAGTPEGQLPDGERLLWRKDELQDDYGHERSNILVQSQSEPNWQAVEDRWEGYFVRPPEVKTFDLNGLAAGDRCMFRLRANVTVSRFDDGQDREQNPRSKRQAVRGAENQVKWLERQAEQRGFSILGTDIVQSGNVRLYKAKNPKAMTLFAVTFEGLLQVHDPAQLAQSVQQGIGKAKALGFGLLSLGRA